MGFVPTADNADFVAAEGSRAKAVAADYAAGSDPGCEREANEDRYLAAQSNFGTGYFVFDGMGGAPCGEAAAQVSSDSIKDFLTNAERQDAETVIRDAIQHAQECLLALRKSPEMASMGTTVVGAYVADNRVAIASIGDSRVYRIGDGFIDQLTEDHTLVQQLVDAGHISPSDALTHPQSHVLTRCLGSDSNFQIDSRTYWLWPTTPGQREELLLLCSDGLYSLVSDQELCEIARAMSPEESVNKLIALARERGGFDNITVLIKPLPGVLRDRPSRRKNFGPEPEDVKTVAPPSGEPEDGISAGGTFASDYRSSGEVRGSRLTMKQLLILGICSGFAAVLTFSMLTMLRG